MKNLKGKIWDDPIYGNIDSVPFNIHAMDVMIPRDIIINIAVQIHRNEKYQQKT